MAGPVALRWALAVGYPLIPFLYHFNSVQGDQSSRYWAWMLGVAAGLGGLIVTSYHLRQRTLLGQIGVGVGAGCGWYAGFALTVIVLATVGSSLNAVPSEYRMSVVVGFSSLVLILSPPVGAAAGARATTRLPSWSSSDHSQSP